MTTFILVCIDDIEDNPNTPLPLIIHIEEPEIVTSPPDITSFIRLMNRQHDNYELGRYPVWRAYYE